jgi:hypothetical protein
LTGYQGLGQLIPAKLAPEIGPALAAAKRTVAPAGPERLAVELPGLFAWARTFGIPFQPSIASAAYRTLADLPPDLLALALERITTKHTLGMRLPFVAEIRATVQDELDERHRLVHAIGRLAFAVKRGDVDRGPGRKKPMTAEQKAEFEAQMARLKAGLASGEPPAPIKPRPPAARLPYADDDRLSEDDQPPSKPPEISPPDRESGSGEPRVAAPMQSPLYGKKIQPPATDDDLSFLTGTVT